jgi:hypothetical protein
MSRITITRTTEPLTSHLSLITFHEYNNRTSRHDH